MRRQSKLIILLLPLLASCSKNTNNTTPSLTVEQNKVYFIATSPDYSSSHLYSFDPVTQNTVMEPSFPGLSGDTVAFQSRDAIGNLQNLYIVEHLSGLPSRVTVSNTSGNIAQNTTDLPQNLYDMMFANNSLYSIGLDKKEIAVSAPLLSSISLSKTSVQGFSNTSTADSESFQFILNNSNNFYVASVGNYPYSEQKPAQIFQLNSNLIQRSPATPNSWPIQGNTAQGSTVICDRIKGDIRITNNKALIACNPANTFPKSQNAPAIFSVDVSSSVPVVTLLKVANPNINIYLGGLSEDKTSVLVTEEDNTSDYYNPVANSYWLNFTDLQNPTTSSTNGGAYSVSYNSTTNSYIFNCILNDSHQCQSNAFGIAPASAGNGIPQSPVTAVTLTNVTNLSGVRGISFFKDM